MPRFSFGFWLAPRACLACGSFADPICRDCGSQILPLRGCAFCGNPLVAVGTDDCEWCRATAHPPDRLISLFPFQGPARRLFHQAKFHGYFRLIGELFDRHPAPPTFQNSYWLVPIPERPWARLTRSTDSTGELARVLSRHYGFPIKRILKHRLYNRRQMGGSRVQRLRNARKKFVVRQELRGARIILVDDVVTTGSTLDAATRLLRRAGAVEVVWLTLFRTP